MFGYLGTPFDKSTHRSSNWDRRSVAAVFNPDEARALALGNLIMRNNQPKQKEQRDN
jgi:hypothetical protein